MSDDQTAEIKPRKVGFLLGAGIFFLPIVFAWFTLRKGHSKLARVLSLGWLGLGVAFWVLAAIGSNNEVPTYEAESEASTDYSAVEAPAEEAATSEEAASLGTAPRSFSDIYTQPLLPDNNFMIGICIMPSAIERCTKEFLVGNMYDDQKWGGAYEVFGKTESVGTIYSRVGENVLDREVRRSVYYFSKTGDLSKILVVNRGVDFDSNCYFPKVFRKSGVDLYATTLPLQGECSEMAQEGNQSYIEQGERRENYETR